MYQRVVKIARVLEETESESRATSLGKRKLEFNKRGPKGINPKQLRPGKPKEKGKQLMAWPNKPLCRTWGKHHNRPCTFETLRCYG